MPSTQSADIPRAALRVSEACDALAISRFRNIFAALTSWPPRSLHRVQILTLAGTCVAKATATKAT